MSLMEVPYYPGCSQVGSAREYDMCTRECMRALGIDLLEIDDWSCCGSTPAHTVDHKLAAALSARNLELVGAMGHNRVTTPCPSCLTNLRTAEHRMADRTFRAEVNELLDKPYSGGVTTKSVLQIIFEDYGVEALKARMVKSLKGLSFAPYYGCIMNRPPEIMRFDHHENPVAMDKIVEALGAEAAPFPLKVECCGAAYGVPREDITAKLTARLLDAVEDCGADAVVTACPLCHMNLDLRQGQVNRIMRRGFNIPVLYITQVIGLALDIAPEKLGMNLHAVDPRPLLKKLEGGE